MCLCDPTHKKFIHQSFEPVAAGTCLEFICNTRAAKPKGMWQIFFLGHDWCGFWTWFPVLCELSWLLHLHSSPAPKYPAPCKKWFLWSCQILVRSRFYIEITVSLFPFCVVSTNLNHTYMTTGCVLSLPCFPHLHTECTTLSSNNLLPRQANVSKASRASPPPWVSPRTVVSKGSTKWWCHPEHLIFRYIQVIYGHYE